MVTCDIEINSLIMSDTKTIYENKSCRGYICKQEFHYGLGGYNFC